MGILNALLWKQQPKRSAMKAILNLSLFALLLWSCEQKAEQPITVEPDSSEVKFTYTPSQEYKDYWFNGTAEISSYVLTQARYGELREGQAVTVFVTEPFSISSNTKADNPSAADPSVLKLNFTKNFNTGIYPYSMMNSSFFPFEDGQHSLKVSTSVQEWCGQVHMELKNREQFQIDIDSYFEGESKSDLKLEKTLLEDDLWSMIRLRPDNLPQGDFEAIPGFFYLRLKHVESKAYKAVGTLSTTDSTSTYSVSYPDLNRNLSITYKTEFPHQITGWTEEYPEGYSNPKIMKTEGRLIKSIRSDYWRRNSNQDSVLRDSLGLK